MGRSHGQLGTEGNATMSQHIARFVHAHEGLATGLVFAVAVFIIACVGC